MAPPAKRRRKDTTITKKGPDICEPDTPQEIEVEDPDLPGYLPWKTSTQLANGGKLSQMSTVSLSRLFAHFLLC